MFGSKRPKNNNSNAWVCSLTGGKFLALRVSASSGKAKLERAESFEAPSWREAKISDWLGPRARLWICLPPEDVETAVLDRPEVGPGEELEALRWELGRANNANLADAFIEGFALPGPEEKGLSRNQWWIGAIERPRLEAILRACEQAGASIARIDAHPLPQRSWAQGLEDQRAIGLLALGEHFSCLGFVSQGNLLFHKQLDWSRAARSASGFGEKAELDLQRSLDYFDRRLSAVATGRLLVVGQDAEPVAELLRSRVTLPVNAMSGSEFIEAAPEFWASPNFGEWAWLLPLCRQVALEIGSAA